LREELEKGNVICVSKFKKLLSEFRRKKEISSDEKEISCLNGCISICIDTLRKMGEDDA
jgi:hypothetical protein